MWGKIIAGLLILIGTQGFGMALSQEMKCFLYHLNEQKQMLFYMMREIDFLHRPMQEIFISLAERLQKPYDSFVRNVARKMEDGSGIGLQEIWDEEIDELEDYIGSDEYIEEVAKKLGYVYPDEIIFKPHEEEDTR